MTDTIRPDLEFMPSIMRPSKHLKGECIMAKKLVKWSLDGSILKLSKIVEGDAKNTLIEIEAEFDMAKLLKVLFVQTWEAITDAGKQAFVYAIKQKLMDTGASEVGQVGGKIQRAKDKYAELLKGKWTGDRVNATGVSENKKMLASMKETSKVVSLEGLIMKKAMAKFPGQESFTEADETKLQELLGVAAKATIKK
jgi:hypothetical protein